MQLTKPLVQQSTKKARYSFDRSNDMDVGLVASSSTIVSYVMLVLLAVIFGSNFMMTKIAVAELPPMFVVFLRIAIACAMLTGVMWLAGLNFPKGPIWVPLIASGLFGHTLPFSLLAWGQQSVDAGLAAILMATMPLFTLLLAQVFTDDEKPNRYSIAGFSLALVGIVLLFGFDKLASLGDQSVRQYAVALAAICYGINAIITKQLAHMGVVLLFDVRVVVFMIGT